MDDYDIISMKNKDKNTSEYNTEMYENTYLITINDIPYCFTNGEKSAKNIIYTISKDIQQEQKYKYPHCNYNINYTIDGCEIVSNNHCNILLIDLVEFYIKYKQIKYKHM